MKTHARLIENLLLTMLLLGGMIGIYLYAGRQDVVSAAQEVPPEQTEQAETDAEQPFVLTSDGRMREAVLAVFSDAGYRLPDLSEARCFVFTPTGDRVAELILSEHGDRVNGLTLRIPLPNKPEEKKNPTLTDEAKLKRYEKDLVHLANTLPSLLQASLDALDPYGEVPTTSRLYWESLLLAALDGDRSVTDTEGDLRFRLYETKTAEETVLSLMLQMQ